MRKLQVKLSLQLLGPREPRQELQILVIPCLKFFESAQRLLRREPDLDGSGRCLNEVDLGLTVLASFPHTVAAYLPGPISVLLPPAAHVQLVALLHGGVLPPTLLPLLGFLLVVAHDGQWTTWELTVLLLSNDRDGNRTRNSPTVVAGSSAS